MIIRKPTKIELKPEEDFYEYEDFKKSQLEQQKQHKKSLLNPSQRVPNERLISDNFLGGQMRLNLSNEMVNRQQYMNQQQSQQLPQTFNNSPPYDFLNFQRPLPNVQDLQGQQQLQQQEGQRNDMPINQLFSMLLNNLEHINSSQDQQGLNISHDNNLL